MASSLSVVGTGRPAPLPAVPTESRSLDGMRAAAARSAAAALPATASAAPPELTDDTGPSPASPAPIPVARPRPIVVRAASRPARLWSQLRRGLTVRGSASWYPGSSGYAGVAHVAMPGARFLARGSGTPRARVCADGRCTVVRVVDACGCHVGTSRARVVDLSAATLQRLGLDPARGVYRVRVTLLAP